MSDEKVYMRFNLKGARWEPTGWSWESAIRSLGDSYDLKLVRDGYETFKPKGKEPLEQGELTECR